MSPPKLNVRSQTDGVTPLQSSPALKRLQASLHDLIVIACQQSMLAPGNTFALSQLTFVSDEKSEGRFSMHFGALVKALELNVNIPLTLTLNVEQMEGSEWF